MTQVNDAAPHAEMSAEPEVYMHGLDFRPMATFHPGVDAVGYGLPGTAKPGEAVNLLMRDGAILYEMYFDPTHLCWARKEWRHSRASRHTVSSLYPGLLPVGWQPVPRGVRLK